MLEYYEFMVRDFGIFLHSLNSHKRKGTDFQIVIPLTISKRIPTMSKIC